MKRTLVCCHPYDKSFNAAIKQVIVDSHKNGNAQLRVFDLQELRFDPVMSAKELREFARAQSPEGINVENLDPLAVEMSREIGESNELVLLFPIWWELMPAQMKGFIDKVIFPGLFYKYVGKFRMQQLSDSLVTVTVITTMNTPSFIYRFLFRNCIIFALKNGTFKKLGVKNFRWLNLSGVKFKSQKTRQRYLHQVSAMFQHG